MLDYVVCLIVVGVVVVVVVGFVMYCVGLDGLDLVGCFGECLMSDVCWIVVVLVVIVLFGSVCLFWY